VICPSGVSFETGSAATKSRLRRACAKCGPRERKEHGQTERALVGAVSIGFLELLNAIKPTEEKSFWEARLTILKNTLTIR
jgi:hypothetical protein